VEGTDGVTGATAPSGWYPDPGGAEQWRRWEGTSWGDATMPFAPRMPEQRMLDGERAAWSSLRPVAPWAIAAPALAAISLASESQSFGAVRRWVHAYLNAELHHHALPKLAASALPTSSTLDSFITIAVTLLTLLGLFAWVRFSTSSIRVATAATYPQRHGPIAASASIVVPVIGPLVAWAASRANLPAGHEARRVLALGWAFVVAGETTFLALYATVLWTSSLAVAWVVAAACILAWAAAAFELPVGLAAIAEDHETLDVRARRASS
jgi:hypothetical protein